MPRGYDNSLRNEFAQQTRDRVLNAATEAIRSRGMDGITYKMVAEMAGVSERTVYRLFEKKQDLLLQVLLARFLDNRPMEIREHWEELPHLVESLMEVYFEDVDLLRAYYNSRYYAVILREYDQHFAAQLDRVIESLGVELSPEDLTRARAALKVLLSGRTWIQIKDMNDFGIDEVKQTVIWMIGALEQKIRSQGKTRTGVERTQDPGVGASDIRSDTPSDGHD